MKTIKNEREANREEVKRKPKEGNKRTVSQLTTTAEDHMCILKNVAVCLKWAKQGKG